MRPVAAAWRTAAGQPASQGCAGEARPLHLIHGGASFFVRGDKARRTVRRAELASREASPARPTANSGPSANPPIWLRDARRNLSRDTGVGVISGVKAGGTLQMPFPYWTGSGSARRSFSVIRGAGTWRGRRGLPHAGERDLRPRGNAVARRVFSGRPSSHSATLAVTFRAGWPRDPGSEWPLPGLEVSRGRGSSWVCWRARTALPTAMSR
jgi:hypothetical protein